ncbi:MAG: M28 family peptidase [Candidatus Hodarchaeales archaeon]
MKNTKIFLFFLFLLSLVATNILFMDDELDYHNLDDDDFSYDFSKNSKKNSISNVNAFPGFSELSEQINNTYFKSIKSHISNFSSFKSRVTGYSGYEQSAGYIQDFFTNQNLENVSTITYPLLVPLDLDTQIEISGMNFTAHTLMPNSLNPSKTPTNGLSGTLVYGGTGTYTDLDGKQIEGSIVVLEFNSQDNWIKVASLGAKGVIFLAANETNRFEADEKTIDIPLYFPRLYLENQTTIVNIRNLSKQNNQLITLYSNMEWKSIEAKNIMGLLPGRDEDIIIISAHFDSLSIVPSIAPGADEACGIATLLELIRIIKDNDITPEKTIMFLALSGHNQGAAGARNFVDQYYDILNVDSGIKLFISLDLSASNDKIAINPYGYLYKFLLQYTTGNKLLETIEVVGEDFLLKYSEDIQKETAYSFEVKSFVTKKEFREIAPITFVGDQEPFVASNVAGLSLFTSETHRLMFNTPLDLPNENMQDENLKGQVVYSICALTKLILEPELDNTLVLQNEYFSLNVANNAHVGYGYIEGYVKEYNQTSAWLNNVPGALVRIKSYSTRYGTYGEYTYITKADENGYYQVRGVSSSQPDYPLDFIVEAYSFDPKGNIVKAIDLGTRGQYFDNLNALETRRTTVNPTVFECGTVSIFGLYHPFSQVQAADTMSFQTLSHDTRNSFFSFGYIGSKSVSLVFIIPENPAIIVGEYPGGLLGVYATNSSESVLRGNGFKVRKGEFINLGIGGYITSRDYLSMTKTYISLYSSYNIQDALVDETFQKASSLMNNANALKNSYEYSRSIIAIQEAQSWSYDSFTQARKVIEDGTLTTIFFAILLLPFAFAMSSLLFDFDTGIKRILATSGIYGLTLGFFYFIHPGMHLSKNIAMILVGVVATIFVFPALYMIYQEGYDFLKSLRVKSLGAHFTDTSRTSTILIAMSTGISRMKKRKGRTIIALSGIILITFSLTLFTSASTQVSTFQKSTDRATPYEGLYFRTKDWEFSLPEEMIDILEVNWGTKINLSTRWWLYPPSDLQDSPIGYVNVETLEGDNNWQGQVILGLTPFEPMFQPINSVLLSGRWFNSSSSNECVLSNSLSNKLNVLVNDTVIWAGQKFLIVGIIDSSGFDKLKDIDDEKISPKDTHASATNIHVPLNETLILPALTAKTLGATLTSISVITDSETAIDIAKTISSTYGRDLQIIVGFNNEATLYRRSVQSLGEGLGELGIPLLIAILLMINTSVSTVYESRKEINTFTSLGLAPSHIAGLFLAEFLVYAVIGSVIGYLMGITSAVVLSALGVFPETLAINYSSGSVVSALGLGIAGILLSTIYPLRISAKMSVPSVRRTWELKTTYAEDGKTWVIPLPFVAASEQEADGIIEFLREFFLIYESESVGGSFFAQDIHSSETDEVRKEKHLTAIVNLAPFDAGLKQKVDLFTYLDEEKYRYVFEISLERLEGILLAWESSVRRFVDVIRKQLLIWRNLPKEVKASKAEQFIANLEQ